jgi:phosphatidylethanolamine-binding protein (PEBP) family uncharacterized protein
MYKSLLAAMHNYKLKSSHLKQKNTFKRRKAIQINVSPPIKWSPTPKKAQKQLKINVYPANKPEKQVKLK